MADDPLQNLVQCAFLYNQEGQKLRRALQRILGQRLDLMDKTQEEIMLSLNPGNENESFLCGLLLILLEGLCGITYL